MNIRTEIAEVDVEENAIYTLRGEKADGENFEIEIALGLFLRSRPIVLIYWILALIASILID